MAAARTGAVPQTMPQEAVLLVLVRVLVRVVVRVLVRVLLRVVQRVLLRMMLCMVTARPHHHPYCGRRHAARLLPVQLHQHGHRSCPGHRPLCPWRLRCSLAG